VLAWCLGDTLRGLEIGGTKPLKALSDAVIAMAGGLALFALPVDYEKGTHALDWKDCETIPWDVLLLFGGGLSMAAAIQSTGGAQLIAAQATVAVGLPTIVVVVLVAALVVFATEFTSNTALAATMLPLLAAAAPTLGISSEILLLVTTLGASAAFMMPVATPPNAIVFGTGRLKIMDMIRAGFLLNIIAIIVIVGVVMIVQTEWLHLIQ
jgi:sodium-dependent dicarboxylate transporter 2/3/5